MADDRHNRRDESRFKNRILPRLSYKKIEIIIQNPPLSSLAVSQYCLNLKRVYPFCIILPLSSHGEGAGG
ncbi:hypothetical protein MTBBW1_80039 [Desulfamplus magnetovallimortis]|uniref:Uncharacterized protein n=1 Tax=Desulfamplus magnetovallimortis TaxID=1246637 RepID=L0R551_9BACT|nr:hypothetical protein DEMABW1_80039 [Desulfamplus magnetovallimortis BW-1]SLM32701.1 hypothetical protein MTBBW1_80039 [Desulfamplus magnetovallimortis]